MRASDLDTMYADTFISYLPHDINIHLIGIDHSGEYTMCQGTKNDVLNFLKNLETNEGVRLVLCDTSAVYLQHDGFYIYLE